jgi:hypothetical protein
MLFFLLNTSAFSYIHMTPVVSILPLFYSPFNAHIVYAFKSLSLLSLSCLHLPYQNHLLQSCFSVPSNLCYTRHTNSLSFLQCFSLYVHCNRLPPVHSYRVRNISSLPTLKIRLSSSSIASHLSS